MSSFPTCQICRQQFSLKGPAPFLLPCLHDVCETCVTAAAGGVISCSTCQRDVNLTETPLQKDVITEKEVLHLTVKHNPELVLCTHEEDGNQAVCWCKDCEDFLCENCQMTHSRLKITKHHEVQDIGELQPGSLEEEAHCRVHPRYILDAWDKHCGMLTCGKCRLEDHAGHKVVDFDAMAKTAKDEVAALGRKITTSADERGAHSTAREQDLQSSVETCDMVGEKITHTINDMKSLLNQREKELQIELQHYKENLKEELGEKMSCDQRCQTTSQYITKTLKYSSRHDIMSLRPLLQSKAEECISSLQASTTKNPPLPRFNTDGLDRIKSVLSGFGSIVLTDSPMFVEYIKDSESQAECCESKDWNDLKKELALLKKKNHILRENLNRLKMEEQSELYRLKGNVTCVSREYEDLKKELDRLKIENQTLKENLNREKMEKQFGLRGRKANVMDIDYLLNCTRVEFSKKRYNAEMVHINTESEMINLSLPRPPYSSKRLKKYWGTSSTAPLPQCESPQYFEVVSRVGIDKPLKGTELLLEIGLATEEEQDQSHCIGGQPHSYSLIVSHCLTHDSVCRKVWRHSKRLMCLPDALENTPGSSATLHYGVVYDSTRGRIAFIDVRKNKIICRVRNIALNVALWPMFGVYFPDDGTISMSLIVGDDINKIKEKKALILKCLS